MFVSFLNGHDKGSVQISYGCRILRRCCRAWVSFAQARVSHPHPCSPPVRRPHFTLNTECDTWMAHRIDEHTHVTVPAHPPRFTQKESSFNRLFTRTMQQVTEVSCEFQTLGPAATAKRSCPLTHLVVAGICTFLGAAVNEAVRQERSSSVPVNSLQNASGGDTPLRAEGGRLFVVAPGEQVLISSLGQQPKKNQLLTTMQTAETFELSFDITPHDGARPNLWRSIVHFGNSNDQRLGGIFLYPGSTRLQPCVSRESEGDICCGPEEVLPVGQSTHVGVRLVGDSLAVSLNGKQMCSTGGFFENRVPGQSGVDVWFSDPWYPAAEVTVANLVYTPLYACECGPVV